MEKRCGCTPMATRACSAPCISASVSKTAYRQCRFNGLATASDGFFAAGTGSFTLMTLIALSPCSTCSGVDVAPGFDPTWQHQVREEERVSRARREKLP